MNTAMIRRRQLMNMVKVEEAEGNPVVFNTNTVRGLAGLRLYGASEQPTTTGAQLFDVNGGGTGWINPDTGEFLASGANYCSSFIPLNPSTQYRSSFDFKAYVYSYGSNKEFLRRESYASQFTTQEDVYYIRFAISGPADSTLITAKAVMLNKGSALLPYEPYTGGQPSPSIAYPQDWTIKGSSGQVNVDVLGGNLTESNLINGVFASTNGEFQEVSYVRLVNNVMSETLKPGRYTVSLKNNTQKQMQANVWVYDENGQFLSSESLLGYVNLPFKFNMLGNRKIKIGFKYSDNSNIRPEEVYDLMLNYGTESLPYSPYKDPQTLIVQTPNGLPGIPVSEGGNYIDENGQRWVSDYVDFGSREYVQMVKNVLINSGFKISVQSQQKRFVIDVQKELGLIVTKRVAVISNIASTKLPIDSNNEENQIFQFFDSIYWYGTTIFETIENFKSWLENNEFYVCASLANPIRTPLSEEQIQAFKAIHANAPTTTIMNDSDVWMKTKYKVRR